MVYTGMDRIESNFNYCTFKFDDIKSILSVFEQEKKRAVEELKKIYEKAIAESSPEEENKEGSETKQKKSEIIKLISSLEKGLRTGADRDSIFGERVSLFITVSSDRRTINGNDWREIFRKIKGPIKAIVVRFLCNDLKRRIVFSIKETSGQTGNYSNGYEIRGNDPSWINEVAGVFDKIINKCKNNRKQWYDLDSLLEFAFNAVLAGSIFISFMIITSVLSQGEIEIIPEKAAGYLTGLLIYCFIWLFLASNLTMKLSAFLKELYPAVELALNEERANQRKKIYYIVVAVIMPYILLLANSL